MHLGLIFIIIIIIITISIILFNVDDKLKSSKIYYNSCKTN